MDVEDRAALDAQFNLRARHPEYQRYFDHWEHGSASVRGRITAHLELAYGDTPGQRLDAFPATTPGAPLLVFIHGGYWQFLDKAFFSAFAEPWVQAGAAAVSVNYDLAPAVSVPDIVEQARRAVAWCHAHAADWGADPARLYVAGHSAGGHLTAMVVATDWRARGLPEDAVKGGCAISGLYDLEPVRHSYLNEALHLDAATARDNSPLDLSPRAGVPFIAAVGSAETQVFREQNACLVEAWRARGAVCTELTLPGRNHYTAVDALTEPDSALYGALRRQLQLTA